MRALIKSSCAPEAVVPAHGEHHKQQPPRSGKKAPPPRQVNCKILKNIGHTCFKTVAIRAPGMHIIPAALSCCSSIFWDFHSSQTWGSPCQAPQPVQDCIPHQLPNPPSHRIHLGMMLWPYRGCANMMQPMPRSSSFPQVFIYSLPCILCLQIFLLAGGIPREGCSSSCGSLLFHLFLSHTELFVWITAQN